MNFLNFLTSKASRTHSSNIQSSILICWTSQPTFKEKTPSSCNQLTKAHRMHLIQARKRPRVTQFPKRKVRV